MGGHGRQHVGTFAGTRFATLHPGHSRATSYRQVLSSSSAYSRWVSEMCICRSKHSKVGHSVWRFWGWWYIADEKRKWIVTGRLIWTVISYGADARFEWGSRETHYRAEIQGEFVLICVLLARSMWNTFYRKGSRIILCLCICRKYGYFY